MVGPGLHAAHGRITEKDLPDAKPLVGPEEVHQLLGQPARVEWRPDIDRRFAPIPAQRAEIDVVARLLGGVARHGTAADQAQVADAEPRAVGVAYVPCLADGDKRPHDFRTAILIECGPIAVDTRMPAGQQAPPVPALRGGLAGRRPGCDGAAP